MNLKQPQYPVRYLSFNSDGSCFCIGTIHGFSVWTNDPLERKIHRTIEGGVKIVEISGQSNLLAWVGTGQNPEYPSNKVIIWDDRKGHCISDIELRTEVQGVKMTSDKIICVTRDVIHIYELPTLKKLQTIYTVSNGLFAVSQNILAYPFPGSKKDPGQIQINRMDTHQLLNISAHNSSIRQLSLNADGTRLATVSEHGTLVRVFDTEQGKRLREFRRGLDRVQIYSLAFDRTSSFIILSSDKGTIHIFSSGETLDPTASSVFKNKQSSLVFMKDYLPEYFSSQWSCLNFQVHFPNICGFNSNCTKALCLCVNGTLYFYDLASGQICSEIWSTE